MRFVLLIPLGIAIGAFGTVAVLNALRTGTAFPRGVMAVSSYHMAGMREAVLASPCQPEQVTRHLRALQILADDIEPAFLPDGMQDATFSRYAAKMRQRLDTAIARMPDADCPALTIELGNVNDGCKACHRDYR
jgi:cytochrome c556